MVYASLEAKAYVQSNLELPLHCTLFDYSMKELTQVAVAGQGGYITFPLETSDKDYFIQCSAQLDGGSGRNKFCILQSDVGRSTYIEFVECEACFLQLAVQVHWYCLYRNFDICLYPFLSVEVGLFY